MPSLSRVVPSPNATSDSPPALGSSVVSRLLSNLKSTKETLPDEATNTSDAAANQRTVDAGTIAALMGAKDHAVLLRVERSDWRAIG